MKEKTNIRKTKSLILALFSMVLVSLAVITQPELLLYAQEDTSEQTQSTTGIEVEYHTIEEVRNYIKQSMVSPDDKVTYDVMPSEKGNIKMGTVSQKSLDNALCMLNQVRYIAGLSHDVTLNLEQVKMTQAAALVNSLNDELSHFPQKPTEISEELYQLGKNGAGSSNIAMGYANFCDAIVHGYMEDGDDSNIDRVGHRRWILNPSMDATGFGMVGKYQAMYSFSNHGSQNQSGVIWPAQSMPTDYFAPNYPWSISMGYHVDPQKVHIKLTREDDNKVWNFSLASSDGYFNVNNDGYGQIGCIIFRPEGIKSYDNLDRYHVEISGVNTPVSYTVTFFDLYPVEKVVIKEKSLTMKVGEQRIVHVDLIPDNATNSQYILTSKNPSVASVDEWGYVDAKSAGITTITATTIDKKQSHSIQVTVCPETERIVAVRIKDSKSFIIRYNKVRSADGYEIVYSTYPSFKKYKKVLVVKGNDETVKMIVKRNPKAKYYVKVRAYKVIDGKKVYGEYSSTCGVGISCWWYR